MVWGKLRFLIVTFVFAFVSAGFAAQEVPQTMTFDGRAFGNSEATVPMLDTISTKIQILTPAQDCVLYEETQSIDTRATNGYFTIQIGSALSDPKRSGYDSNLAMNKIFANSTTSVAGKKVSDGSACTYNPASGDKRYVRLQMTPAADGVTRSISPNMALDSVPNAMVAETIQGLAPADFVQVNTTGSTVLSQANAENIFSSTNYPNLVNLLSVAPTSYVRTGTNGSATLPSVSGNPATGLTAGQIWYDSVANVIKYYDGTTKTLGTSSGLSSVGLTLPALFTVTGSPLTANGSISATLANQNANLVFAGPSSGGAAAPTFRAIASSDLPITGATGMYLNGGNSFGAAATIGTNDSNTFAIKTNGTSRMFFDTSGNVGVGTATPGRLLDVAGTGADNSGIGDLKATGSGSIGSALTLAATSAGGRTYSFISTASGSGAGGGKLGLFDSTAVAYRMVVDSAGNVGIGTTTPSSKLDILGNNAAANAPLALNVLGGNTTASGIGGGVSLAAGNALSGTTGALLSLTGGQWGGTGGSANLTAGAGGNGWYGGDVNITGGIYSGYGSGGEIVVKGGNYTGAVGGNVLLNGGSGTVAGNVILANLRGNVGIGTTTPFSAPLGTTRGLEVTGTGLSDVATIRLSSAGAPGVGTATNSSLNVISMFNNGYDEAVLYSGGGSNRTSFAVASTLGSTNYSAGALAASTKFLVTSTGNVGIGTTSPSQKLEIVETGGGDASILIRSTANSASLLMQGYDSTYRWLIGNNSSGHFGLREYGWGAQEYLHAEPGLTSAAIPIYIKSNGNVGIGTSSPGANLQVDNTAGDSVIYVRSTTNGAALKLDPYPGNSTNRWNIQASGGGSNTLAFRDAWNAVDVMTLETGAGVNRIYVKSGGNVGIGTTSPQTALQVAGVISPATDNTHTLGDATYRFTTVYATNGVINTSDRREKKDIYNTDLGLDFINKLRPVSYRWNTGVDSDIHYGLIAQEAEQAIAEVGKTEKTSIVTHDETTDRYGVRYSELISPIIKAVQELYLRILGIDREIASVKVEKADKTEVEAKFQKLESENEKLKQENAAKAQEMAELKAYLCAQDKKATICK